MGLAGAVGFDATVFELFGALLNGGTVYPVSQEVLLDTKRMAAFLHDHAIETMFLTAGLFNLFAQEQAAMFGGMRHLIIGGESLSAPHIKLVASACSEVTLWNGYGPTENTTFSVCYRIEGTEEPIPIGRPISHSTALILNGEGKLVPIGVPGELYVGGDGVARGYLNAPELTAEKFVPNPFEPEGRMYKTGDLAKWLPDGNIAYMGRTDHQVKIRGHRIELTEIEAQLLKGEQVKEAVVIVRANDQGQNELCAYVVAAEEELTVARLRGELSQVLPSYMVPAYFVQLEKFPLTQNGKLDRKALPAPEGQLSTGVVYVAPRNETEQLLANIWQDVLGVSEVGIHDSFFELGGHSLKAMTLLSRMRRELGVDIALGELFRHPTLEALAEAAASVEKTEYAAIRPVAERPYYPVSSAQKRMYVLRQLEGAGQSYNMPIVLQLEGTTDRQRVEQAMQSLIVRHESLRTSFAMNEGEAVQIVHPEVTFAVSTKLATEAETEQVVAAFVRPFDLSVAPLLRTELVELASERHLLLVDIHHIVSDGVSMGVLVEEFMKLYAGETLQELRIQYKDYAAWQQARAGSEALKQQEAYWLETFAGELPVLQLPTDYPRPAVQRFEGSEISFTLNAELTSGLKRLAEETGTTLYMVLLAAFNVLLFKYTGQEDIIVGSPIA